MEIYNLEKNNSEKISVGVDIGGTAVKIGLFYENGKIITKTEIPTRQDDNCAYVLSDTADTGKKLIKETEVDINNIFCNDDLQIASPIVSDLQELLSPAFGEIMNSMKDILSTVSVDSLLKKYNY